MKKKRIFIAFEQQWILLSQSIPHPRHRRPPTQSAVQYSHLVLHYCSDHHNSYHILIKYHHWQPNNHFHLFYLSTIYIYIITNLSNKTTTSSYLFAHLLLYLALLLEYLFSNFQTPASIVNFLSFLEWQISENPAHVSSTEPLSACTPSFIILLYQWTNV